MTEKRNHFARGRRKMEPSQKVVDGITSIINKHIDCAMILKLLTGVAKVDTLTQLIHCFDQGRGSSGTSGRAAAGTLAGTNNGGGIGVLIWGIGDAVGRLDAVYNVVERVLPHGKRSRRGTHDGEAK
jgi:hypothetical protein